MAAGDVAAICTALISAAFHEDDGKWVQDWALELLAHPSADVRHTAALTVGHVARIHRYIDHDLVVPRLQALLDDPEIGGAVENALDDIRMFTDAET
ncbi:hypothetical protein ACFQYP_54320 [Nonomuraea antimicrobica]|uniref:hypothetical protein n=1 Tax=Nonomuraea antimicrobica TaxID=561173 RepID=UPI0031F09B65